MTCLWRNSYLESEGFYVLALHILSTIQFSLSAFGAYIILWKTPKTMEKIKFSLLLMHITTGFMDLVLSVLSQPYIIFTSGAGYPLGLLVRIGVPSVVVMYLTICSCFSLGPAILMFFEERYNRLLRPDADDKSRQVKGILYYTFNYLAILIAVIPTTFTIPDQEAAKKSVLVDNPCLPLSVPEHPNFIKLTESTTSTVLFMVGYATFSGSQSFFHFLKVLHYLRSTNALSERTASMQKQLLIALCIQAQAPILVILIPGSYLQMSGVLRYFDMALSNIGMICFASHGIFSTVIMLFIHAPYRDATMEIFRRPVLKVDNSSQFNSFVVTL